MSEVTTITREFPANFKALNDAMVALDERVESLPQAAAYDLRLACEEIFINIINYAYPTYEAHKTGGISITWVDDPNARQTTVTFTDTGIAFNPLDHPIPKPGRDIARQQIGGLGIMLVRQRLSGLHYDRVDGKNIFSLTRNWDV